MFCCYILYSEKLNQTYVGYTSDINKRLNEHKYNPTRTTSRSDDYKLIWYCGFKSKQLATNFEKYLKSGSGRAFMRKRLIGSLDVSD